MSISLNFFPYCSVKLSINQVETHQRGRLHPTFSSRVRKYRFIRTSINYFDGYAHVGLHNILGYIIGFSDKELMQHEWLRFQK